MRKGDIVRVRATAHTAYAKGHYGDELIYSAGNRIVHKHFFRHKADFVGMIVGRSFRVTGQLEPEDCLSPGKFHPVWMVEKLAGRRYFKPIACLEEDLEVIQQAQPRTAEVSGP